MTLAIIFTLHPARVHIEGDERYPQRIEENQWLGRGVSVTTVLDEFKRTHFHEIKNVHRDDCAISQRVNREDLDRTAELPQANCRERVHRTVLHLTSNARSTLPLIMIFEKACLCRRFGTDRTENVRCTNVQRHLCAMHRIRVCNPD